MTLRVDVPLGFVNKDLLKPKLASRGVALRHSLGAVSLKARARPWAVAR